ncbi:MAG: cold shock domain-containing protein [Rhodospirillaceae bacterium]
MYDRSPRSFNAPAITQSGARATVKWFNPTKGFGFVTPEDGSPDAFLHISAVQAAGHDALPEGATIICDLSHGPKGPQVATISSVDTSTASAGGGRPQRSSPRGGDFGHSPRGPSRGGWGGQDDDQGGDTVEGTVKWFNADKGFGFVAPQGGGKDVFVHRSALERSGLHALADGEPVRLTVRQGQKGPEAVRVEVL